MGTTLLGFGKREGAEPLFFAKGAYPRCAIVPIVLILLETRPPFLFCYFLHEFGYWMHPAPEKNSIDLI